jgi:ribosomal protein L22
MKTAIAKETNAKVSLKHSRILSRKIVGKRLDKAKNLLEGLVSRKKNLEGKYYTKTSKKFLDIIKAATANAKQKNLAPEKLFIKSAKADKGETLIRPRSRWHLRGRRQRSSTIEIVLEEK